MKPSRILPDLQCSLLCEDVRHEANGNFILIGVISFVRVPQLPVTALKLCLFNRWAAVTDNFWNPCGSLRRIKPPCCARAK